LTTALDDIFVLIRVSEIVLLANIHVFRICMYLYNDELFARSCCWILFENDVFGFVEL